MIGGPDAAVRQLDPLFGTMAPGVRGRLAAPGATARP